MAAGRVADSGIQVSSHRRTRSGLTFTVHRASRPSRSATADSGVLGPAAERSRTSSAISSSSRLRRIEAQWNPDDVFSQNFPWGVVIWAFRLDGPERRSP